MSSTFQTWIIICYYANYLMHLPSTCGFENSTLNEMLADILTPDRWQSKTLLTIEERGSKIVRNSVFDCQLTPDWRQMAIKTFLNYISNNF